MSDTTNTPDGETITPLNVDTVSDVTPVVPAASTTAVVDHPAQAAKIILYILLTGLGSAITVLGTGAVHLTTVNVLMIAVAVLGAIPVYYASADKYVKVGVAFAVALLQGLIAVIGNGGFQGVTVIEWFTIILAAFAAIGVHLTPNAPLSTSTQYNVGAGQHSE